MKRYRSEDYMQMALIGLGLLATAFFGVFFYREVFPEYKIYQEDYVELEKFRSTYTGQAAPAFKFGLQQIVIPREDKGPETIDRCTSCHVALKLEHFSPTKIAKDINGNIVRDTNGIPVKIPNDNYVFLRLDEKILELRDPKVNAQLEQQGDTAQVKEKIAQANKLEALKVAKVGDNVYQVPKVLAMHPLMGRETRPFEFHSPEEIGCTVCHGGNGRGLTTDKAHGPVFDNMYDYDFEGPEPIFNEIDPKNDPQFAHVFNHKPSDDLTFQTTPILVGGLMQSKCVQCHNPSSVQFERALGNIDLVSQTKSKEIQDVQKSLLHDEDALIAILNIRASIHQKGLEKTLKDLDDKSKNYELPSTELEYAANQMKSIQQLGGTPLVNKQYKQAEQKIFEQLDKQLIQLLGSTQMGDQIEKILSDNPTEQMQKLTKFLEEQRQKGQTQGVIFAKLDSLDFEKLLIQHLELASSPLELTAANAQVVAGMQNDVDVLTKEYQNGQQLFISQACYACHRIAGFSRGGIGPELTTEGLGYPWFIKQSIVWPQADLKTSTMPNTKMDHDEIEGLMTFLLAQRGPNKATSPVARQTAIRAWDEGKKMWWEKPISPAEIQDVRGSMIIFATQGCANCHRLKTFESNVGFTIQKGKPSFDELHEERQWFENLFPDDILGSELSEKIIKNVSEIDKHIAADVRVGSILEEIEAKYPGTIETFYTNFKFANRAQNDYYAQLIAKAKDPEAKSKIEAQHKDYQDRVHRVLMIYIQEYGLGRVIGPRVNWSGVYRSDQWLMEHFWKPTSQVARSIMPVFPFDNTKFLALTHMLDVLGRKNTDELHTEWSLQGFNPEEAYQNLCSQCHGPYLQGDGPVSLWIYPIPKNLRNSVFMINYTKERVINSITNGVQGTPMPPWGEVARGKQGEHATPVLNKEQIQILSDWLFEGLGANNIQPESEIMKWEYTPEDFIKELKRIPLDNFKDEKTPKQGAMLQLYPRGDQYLAAIEPMPVKGNNLTVEDIFDVVPYKDSTVDKKAYYIKKIYYTPENLAAGEALFNLNCAVCHGKEGDGSGNRAGSMTDAKPRMLTNLNWLETRDDLRLLRSIKYGVPGTSMIAWGDFTNALQRMQLVMYIRSLTEDPLKNDQLQQAIYQAFFENQETLEQARTLVHEKLDKYQSDYDKHQIARTEKSLHVDMTEGEVFKEYQIESTLRSHVQSYSDIDDSLLNLIDINKKEQQMYYMLGNRIITTLPEDKLFTDYLKMIALNENRFSLKDNVLTVNVLDVKKFNQLFDSIHLQVKKKMSDLIAQKEKMVKESTSSETPKELSELSSQISAVEKIKDDLIALDGQTKRQLAQEKQIVDQFNIQMKELGKKE